jgi:hypothetical protein
VGVIKRKLLHAIPRSNAMRPDYVRAMSPPLPLPLRLSLPPASHCSCNQVACVRLIEHSYGGRRPASSPKAVITAKQCGQPSIPAGWPIGADTTVLFDLEGLTR